MRLPRADQCRQKCRQVLGRKILAAECRSGWKNHRTRPSLHVQLARSSPTPPHPCHMHTSVIVCVCVALVKIGKQRLGRIDRIDQMTIGVFRDNKAGLSLHRPHSRFLFRSLALCISSSLCISASPFAIFSLHLSLSLSSCLPRSHSHTILFLSSLPLVPTPLESFSDSRLSRDFNPTGLQKNPYGPVCSADAGHRDQGPVHDRKVLRLDESAR
jgi:hypothetical protein